MSFDYDPVEVLTFDTYGTLIDWETGITEALRRALPELANVESDDLLERCGAPQAVPDKR
jgi:FMN phosphatase YigB (HAD superfamily)